MPASSGVVSVAAASILVTTTLRMPSPQAAEAAEALLGTSTPATLSAQLGVEHDRAALHAGVSWRSEMLDVAGVLPSDPSVPALLLVDAAASVQLHPRVRLYAVGTNLTRETTITSWRPFGARPTAPMQVLVGVKVEG